MNLINNNEEHEKNVCDDIIDNNMKENKSPIEIDGLEDLVNYFEILKNYDVVNNSKKPIKNKKNKNKKNNIKK